MTQLVSSKNIINRINNFNIKDFISSNALSDAFYELTKPIWQEIKNNDEMMETKDLSSFSEVQEFLLNEVIRIHEEERITPLDIENKLNHSLHLDEFRGKLKCNYSYNHIYYLDNEKCDYYFVGDIHSDVFIFEFILKNSEFFENIFSNKSFKIIFLGDYIDRGKNHLKTVEYLLLLKYLFPENIYLLMGNHDIGKIEGDEVTLYLKKVEEEKDYFYYYLRDIDKKNSTFSSCLVVLYQKFLNNLNVIAYPMNKDVSFMLVHGGIPRPTVDPLEDDYFEYIKTHSQFTNSSVDYADFIIKDNMIWSDPSIQHLQPVVGNKRFKFYKEHFDSFKNKIGFDVLIRGHQAMEDGVMAIFDGMLYTVFSTGMILLGGSNINSDTVYDFVTPKVLKFNHKAGLPLEVIDLNL